MNDSDTKDRLENEDAVAVRLEWHIPEDMNACLATHMLVSHTQEGEFVITFCEAKLPPREDQSAVARAVARVAVISERIPGMIDALQRNYDRWKERQGGGDK